MTGAGTSLSLYFVSATYLLHPPADQRQHQHQQRKICVSTLLLLFCASPTRVTAVRSEKYSEECPFFVQAALQCRKIHNIQQHVATQTSAGTSIELLVFVLCCCFSCQPYSCYNPVMRKINRTFNNTGCNLRKTKSPASL
jgi:hypothetical protein